MRRPRWRTVFLALAVALVAVLAIGAAWLATPQPTLPEADAALTTTDELTVSQDDGRLTFTPADSPRTGLVLYPGGRVPPQAYAPAARLVAQQGYLVVVVSMPFNLAVFDINAADPVRADHPQISRWAVGGHSLGGAMAAQYVANRPGEIDGLVLWAAYSAVDLSDQPLSAVTIYGTLDEGRESFTSADALSRLPPSSVVVAIAGGNHANFGWYTGQPDDPPALISRDEQQATAAEATVALLAEIEGRADSP